MYIEHFRLGHAMTQQETNEKKFRFSFSDTKAHGNDFHNIVVGCCGRGGDGRTEKGKLHTFSAR